MKEILLLIFCMSVVYAVIGNIIVYMILIHHKIPLRSFWVGTPGYLYRICKNASPTVGPRIRRFALSTNIAFLVAMVLGIGFAGFQEKI